MGRRGWRGAQEGKGRKAEAGLWCFDCGQTSHTTIPCSVHRTLQAMAQRLGWGEWCPGCGAYGHTLALCPMQDEEEEPLLPRPMPEGEEPERPTPEWEEPKRPTPEWEEPKRPTPEWEEPKRPTPEPERPTPAWGEPERPQPKRGESVRPQPKEGGVGASTALGPKQPAEGECLLVPPPLLPPQEPEGEELQAQPPEIFSGGEGQDAGVPQLPLFLLLKAAWRALARPPQQREPAPPQPPSEWPASAPSPLPPPPPPAESEYLLVPPSLLWEDCLPLPPQPAEGSTVAGAPERVAAGHEKGGGGLETTNPSSSFASGVTVAGAPQRGAAGYEEGGGQGTTCPRSFFAAGRDQQAVSCATTGRGADSIASHGPTEASLPSPRLCPGLLGF
ncbi:UNVERIFIED_CONTAM: hypothetical protein FKN15_014634 [Acipenser sinensis]